MYASLRRRGCKCCTRLQRLKIAWKCSSLSHQFSSLMRLWNQYLWLKMLFPTFEVDEESLVIPLCLPVVEIVASYFDSIKSHNRDKEYQSSTDGTELLGSMDYNMMKFLSDECVSKESLVLSDMFTESDFIIMLETEHFDVNTASHGTSEADSGVFTNLVTFQEFMFLDEDFVPSSLNLISLFFSRILRRK